MTQLPFKSIPQYPDNYKSGNIIQRIIQGLGYRYYWATEGLTDKDLKYRPSNKAMSSYETLEHIYGLAETINNTSLKKVNYRPYRDAPENFESIHKIVPTNYSGAYTAAIFGEFFPNPGYKETVPHISEILACIYEGVGTFILMASILFSTKNKAITKFSPLVIGFTVALLIIWIAPFTQCGINPARDFGPRLVAYFFHWGNGAFPIGKTGFLTVYIVSPLFGAFLATIFFNTIHKVFREKVTGNS